MTTTSLWGAVARLLRHRWRDHRVRGALSDAALQRLKERIARSEKSHGGQIRLCIEGGLPWSYLRRHASSRERALMMFSKLRVWDTEHNNGVLIYLLLAERSIEIVADRGLNVHVQHAEWRQLIAGMAPALRKGQFEQGLAQAIDMVHSLAVRHAPRLLNADHGTNELADEPCVA